MVRRIRRAGVQRMGVQPGRRHLPAEPHGDLDGEVHGHADEQHGVGDRDQVQRAHRQRRERRRQQQSQHQRQQDRRHQPPAPHRQPQQRDDERHARRQPPHGAAGDGGELLVLQRDLAGQADVRLAGADELQAGGGVPHGLGCGGAGLHGAVVQPRLRQHEVVAPGQVRHRPGQQPLPRHHPGVPRRRVGQGQMERPQRRLERLQVGLARLHALRDQPERAQQPAQAGVGGELAQEGLRVHRLVQQGRQRAGVQVEQPVLLQEGRGVGPAHLLEVRRVQGEGGGQRLRRGLGLLGHRGVDHGDQQVPVLREGALQLDVALPPRQAGREQAGRVGRHLQPRRRNPQGPGCQQRRQQRHPARPAHAQPDQPSERRAAQS